jgi:hypothetical protein
MTAKTRAEDDASRATIETMIKDAAAAIARAEEALARRL